MLKNFKDTEGFVENVGLSRSTTYFKIGLYKFLTLSHPQDIRLDLKRFN